MSNKRPSFYLLRKKWIANNPPDENGNYECWLCKQPVHIDKVTIDHVAPVHLYPEYAKNLSNLKPSHEFCNQQRAVPKEAKLTRHVRIANRRAKV